MEVEQGTINKLQTEIKMYIGWISTLNCSKSNTVYDDSGLEGIVKRC